MIRFLLSLFKPFRALIERGGADYEQFMRILELKLTIDNRKQGRNKGSSERSLILQSVGQIAMGAAFALISLNIKESFTFYYVMHTIIMVILAMTIISEFTTILFDTSENMIIQPLPIKGSTVSMARNAHVFLYLALIAVNYSLVAVVVSSIKYGIVSGLMFLSSVFLNVLFTLFLANVLYLGLMHIASGEKLKTILMYFQIGIAVLFMAGYQFGLQAVDASQVSNLLMHISWYTYLIPPAIFAGFTESVATVSYAPGNILFIVEALLLPVITLLLTSRYLTPVFNRKLLQLESGDKATKVSRSTGKTTIYYRVMETLFTRNTTERTSFQLAWRMSGYERLFKQSFFPSLAYVLIMIVAPFFKRETSVQEILNSDKYLIFLYAFMLISFTLTNSLSLGNNRNVGWIFKFLPVAKPADLFKGFIKAVFARFFNPFYLVVSVGVVAFWGPAVIPDVIIAWMAIYLTTTLMYYIQGIDLPFSQQKAASQGGKNMLRVFGLMIMAGIMGWGHYFIVQIPYLGHIVLTVLYVSGIWISNKYAADSLVKWEKVDFSSSAD